MNAKILLCLIISLTTALSQAEPKPVATESGAVAGKKYVSMVTDKMLLHQPKWDPLVSPIPLAADAACKKALQFANGKWNFQNVRDELGQWDARTISIARIEKSDWVYVIEILQRGPILGIRSPMRLIVLLDGTVVQPSEAGREIP